MQKVNKTFVQKLGYQFLNNTVDTIIPKSLIVVGSTDIMIIWWSQQKNDGFECGDIHSLIIFVNFKAIA